MKISVDDLADTIVNELADYSRDITEGLKKDIREVAKETVADAKENSPRRTGKYAKGWHAKDAYESSEDLRVAVHNRTDYQLTHLLENGHACKNGTGRVFPKVKAYPHIEQAEQKAAEKLGQKVKVTIRGCS